MASEQAPETHRKKIKKPYEEITSIFNGNEIKIRIPKTKYKTPKLTPSQQLLEQTCTCEDPGSDCSETCGLQSGEEKRKHLVDIQIPDNLCEGISNRTSMNSEVVYQKTSAYNHKCNVCNVTPQGTPKGVKAEKLLYKDKDVFLLKIGKQSDEPNRTGNIEVELVTPKAPAKIPPPTHGCKLIQCEEEDIASCGVCKTCRPKKRRRYPN